MQQQEIKQIRGYTKDTHFFLRMLLSKSFQTIHIHIKRFPRLLSQKKSLPSTEITLQQKEKKGQHKSLKVLWNRSKESGMLINHTKAKRLTRSSLAAALIMCFASLRAFSYMPILQKTADRLSIIFIASAFFCRRAYSHLVIRSILHSYQKLGKFHCDINGTHTSLNTSMASSYLPFRAKSWPC